MTTIDATIAHLKDELAKAREELDDVTDEATHPPEAELGGGSPGYANWQASVVIKQHIEQRIEDLQDALQRAEQGLYGICEVCGEQIAAERLKALPFATMCIECASKASKAR